MTARGPADLLTILERDALVRFDDQIKRNRVDPIDARIVQAAIERLAPKPAPAQPRVSELAERWRSEPTTDEERQCADELDSAMERHRKRVHHPDMRARLADVISPHFARASRSMDVLKACDAVISLLLTDECAP